MDWPGNRISSKICWKHQKQRKLSKTKKQFFLFQQALDLNQLREIKIINNYLQLFFKSPSQKATKTPENL